MTHTTAVLKPRARVERATAVIVTQAATYTFHPVSSARGAAISVYGIEGRSVL